MAQGDITDRCYACRIAHTGAQVTGPRPGNCFYDCRPRTPGPPPSGGRLRPGAWLGTWPPLTDWQCQCQCEFFCRCEFFFGKQKPKIYEHSKIILNIISTNLFDFSCLLKLSNGPDASHFPAYAQYSVRTSHTRFLRCEKFCAFAHPTVFDEAVLAEPRGLGGCRGAVTRVYRRCVNTPNEGEQRHEEHFGVLKDMT